jgi:ribonuclease HII
LAVLAGIDEAGYGPLLGPLVVTGVAFRVPDQQLDRCLWKTLRATCASRPHRTGRRLAVADSKTVYRSRDGLAQLERTVLVMLAASEQKPATWRALLDKVAPGTSAHLDHVPWFSGADIPLPLTDTAGDVGTRANALKNDLRRAGCAFLGGFSEPLDVFAYNRMVTSTRNKAVVLLGLTLRVADRILRAFPGERIRFLIDRQGGRIRYRDVLMTSLSSASLTILEESETRSAYRLDLRHCICELDFSVGGDGAHFPVALASMFSKYLRELFMHRFNEYWSARVAGLAPTAGYYTDAMRWLSEWESSPQSSATARNLLVRLR